MSKFRRALSATAMVTLAAVTVAPAYAESVSVQDTNGDVAHGVDLQRADVTHGDKTIRVVTTHADLVPDWKSEASMAVFLDTDRGDKGPEYALLTALYRGGEYTLVATEGWGLRKVKPVEGSYRLRLDYEEETATVRIARSALDAGKRVRVAIRVSGATDDGSVVDWLGEPRSYAVAVTRG